MTVDTPAPATATTTAPAGPALRVVNLSTVFRTRTAEVKAVRSVSFEVEPGETLVLLGESGSGKSVTARSIMRLHNSRAKIEGEVTLSGESVLDLDEKSMRALRGGRVAMVPQDPSAALDPLRRVGKQITEVLLLHKQASSKKDAKAQAVELLRLVGIPDPQRAFRSYPHELSGGMRQRVVIAIGISCDPAVIIADEPTTALDVTVQAQILDLFAELQKRLSTALLMVTHDVLVAADVADVVAVMYAGSIVETGPAREVLENPRHPHTKALLGALPRHDTARGELESIPGAPPIAGQDFAGCSFASRCGFAQESCVEHAPPLLQVGSRHLAACPVLNPAAAVGDPLSARPAEVA
ncbi:MAG: oligopeptide/dipeptide transporter, ATPase subunit [Frankiales bacterium]|nr:oligopeptide/dipeptide transporter, ATPase subunit [Frankiales bacterium]